MPTRARTPHETDDLDGDGAVDDGWVAPALRVALDQKLAKILRAAKKAGASPLSGDDLTTLLSLLRKLGSDGLATVDVTKSVKSTLLKHTTTVDQETRIWHGGGGFTHLEVGPSMFESIGDILVLAKWATRGDFAKAMCAQLGVRYRPDGIRRVLPAPEMTRAKARTHRPGRHLGVAARPIPAFSGTRRGGPERPVPRA